MIRILVAGLLGALWGTCVLAAGASEPPPVARIEGEASRIEDFGADLHVELALSRAVPWRAYTLDAPRRLVLDFSEVDFDGSGLAEILASDGIVGISTGPAGPGWSQLVLHLSEPYAIETAGLSTGAGGGTALKLQLAPTDPRGFAEAAGAPASTPADRPDPQGALPQGRAGLAALDSDHGSSEAGAGAGAFREADLTLGLAQALGQALRLAGMRWF